MRKTETELSMFSECECLPLKQQQGVKAGLMRSRVDSMGMPAMGHRLACQSLSIWVLLPENMADF